jgi:hypothetical protein
MKIYTYRSGHKTLKKILSITLSLLVLVQMTPAAFVVNTAQANHGGPYGDNPVDKIILCHDESGDGTSYHSSGGVNVNAALSGHDGHQTDIIPPFHYQVGNPNSPVLSYAGKNWTASNEILWNNGACDGGTPPAPTTGTLVVQKVVTNDNGGTGVASDFSFQVDGGSVTAFESDGENVILNVAAGAHAVTEVATSTYAVSYSAGCTAGITAGATTTCVITNNDNPVVVGPTTGGLTIQKIVINDDGGVVATSTFSFQVNGGAPINFESDGSNDISGLTAGSYSITESYANYATTFSGSCSSTGLISVTAGATSTCVITNNDIDQTAPTGNLVIVKLVVNDNGGSKLVSDFPLFVGSTGVSSGATTTLTVGSYVVSETYDSSLYAQSFSGDCDANGNASVSANTTSTCVITNNDIAQDSDPELCTDTDANNEGEALPCTYDTTTTTTHRSGGSRGTVLGINNDEPQGQVLGATFEPGLPNTGNGPLDSTETNTLAIIFAGMIALVGLNLASFKALKFEVKSK